MVYTTYLSNVWWKLGMVLNIVFQHYINLTPLCWGTQSFIACWKRSINSKCSTLWTFSSNQSARFDTWDWQGWQRISRRRVGTNALDPPRNSMQFHTHPWATISGSKTKKPNVILQKYFHVQIRNPFPSSSISFLMFTVQTGERLALKYEEGSDRTVSPIAKRSDRESNTTPTAWYLGHCSTEVAGNWGKHMKTWRILRFW